MQSQMSIDENADQLYELVKQLEVFKIAVNEIQKNSSLLTEASKKIVNDLMQYLEAFVSADFLGDDVIKYNQLQTEYEQLKGTETKDNKDGEMANKARLLLEYQKNLKEMTEKKNLSEIVCFKYKNETLSSSFDKVKRLLSTVTALGELKDRSIFHELKSIEYLVTDHIEPAVNQLMSHKKEASPEKMAKSLARSGMLIKSHMPLFGIRCYIKAGQAKEAFQEIFSILNEACKKDVALRDVTSQVVNELKKTNLIL